MVQTSFLDDDPLSADAIYGQVAPVVNMVRGVVSDLFANVQARRAEDQMFSRMEECDLAQWLSFQIRHEASELFSADPMVRYRRQRQQSFLVINEQIVLVYKKLRRVPINGHNELQRSNYPTHRNMQFWAQQTLEGIPELPRVVFGYELIDELTGIRYFLGLPESYSKSMKWLRPIDGESDSEWGPVIAPSAPAAEDEPAFEFVPDEQISQPADGSA